MTQAQPTILNSLDSVLPKGPSIASHLPAIQGCTWCNQIRPYFSLLSKPHTPSSVRVTHWCWNISAFPTIMPLFLSFFNPLNSPPPSLAEDVANFQGPALPWKLPFPQVWSDRSVLRQHLTSVCLTTLTTLCFLLYHSSLCPLWLWCSQKCRSWPTSEFWNHFSESWREF